MVRRLVFSLLCFAFITTNALAAPTLNSSLGTKAPKVASAECEFSSLVSNYKGKPQIGISGNAYALQSAVQHKEYYYQIIVPKGNQDAKVKLTVKPGQYNFSIGKVGMAPSLFDNQKDKNNLCYIPADNIMIKDPNYQAKPFNCDATLKASAKSDTTYFAAFQYIGSRPNTGPDKEKHPTMSESDGNMVTVEPVNESNFSQ